MTNPKPRKQFLQAPDTGSKPRTQAPKPGYRANTAGPTAHRMFEIAEKEQHHLCRLCPIRPVNGGNQAIAPGLWPNFLTNFVNIPARPAIQRIWHTAPPWFRNSASLRRQAALSPCVTRAERNMCLFPPENLPSRDRCRLRIASGIFNLATLLSHTFFEVI